MPLFNLSFRIRTRVPKLRGSFLELQMFYLLLHLMCYQNGPQQAAGVVGYPQFPFLNQSDAAAAAIIVAFYDAAIYFCPD